MTYRVGWVTGATGFIGRHLVTELEANGWRTVCFGRRSIELAGRTIEALDQDGVIRAVAAAGLPDTVFHFAGGATVGASFENPFADFESNVASTAWLLDRVRRISPACHFVMASSSAVYGSNHIEKIGVKSATEPYSPYGYHKLVAEQIAKSYVENFDTSVTILRLFSVYGAGLQKQFLFDVCKKLSFGGTVTLAGSGNEMRDWCHVSDVVRAARELSPAGKGECRVFNIGTTRGSATREVAGLLQSAWGSGSHIEFSGVVRPGDPFFLVADPNSLPPGFSALKSIEKGVIEFVDHFRSQYLVK